MAKDLHLSFRFVQFHLGPGVSFDDPHGLTLSTQDFADFLADEANEPTDEGMKPVGLKTSTAKSVGSIIFKPQKWWNII